MEIIGPVIEILKFVGSSIGKRLRYHRKLQQYVNDLRSTLEVLESRKADVERRLYNQLHSGRIAKKEVENWLKSADEIISLARTVEEKSVTAKCLSRARIGKLVDNVIEELKAVCEIGDFQEGLVVDDPLIVGIKLPTPQSFVEDDVKQRILECLLGDRVGKIAVCGMGGVGKTTIMKHVYNELLNMENGEFGRLIWVDVSKHHDVSDLQDDIALQVRKERLRGGNPIVRAGQLLEMLEKQGRFVLILDDIWKSFLLEDVGIPEPNASNNCKLVLISRSMEVARLMGFEVIKVKPLSEERALNLFLMKAGIDTSPPTLEPIVKLIAKECAGLPLAISAVGSSMKQMYDPRLWINALNELSERSRFVDGEENEVFEKLKFSYDSLKSLRIQYCFLYCSLYPENYDIPKEEIIMYWIEEGIIEQMETREAMVYRGHNTLRRLEENSLLERGCDENHVKMHDLVRDMALQITHSKPRFLVKAGMQLRELPDEQEWTDDIEKVSLMWNLYLDISQGIIPARKCPMLTTLLLSHNDIKMIPESFFENMPNLKILDLSWNPMVSLPNSTSHSENLTALFLGGCKNLEKVPMVSKLQALKHLDLNRTFIRELPEGIELLVNLKYLDMRYTKRLREIPYGILPKLSKIEHLYVHNVLSKEIDQLKKLQFLVGRFHELDDFITFVHSLSRRDWSTKYKITVGPEQFGRFVEVEADYAIKLVNLSISKRRFMLPSSIQALEIFGCDGVRSLDLSMNMKVAMALQRFTINDCAGVLWVLSTWSFQLPNLEHLLLCNLPDLIGLVGPDPGTLAISVCQAGTFSSLKEIGIYECVKLKTLFMPNWVLQSLQNLEKITIYNCEKLEEMIESDDQPEGTIINTIKFVLPKLRKLVLHDLPLLSNICGRSGVMVCDSLSEIYIENCPNLKRIPLFLPILGNGGRAPPHSLHTISVDKEWWESSEWDHLDSKEALQPFVQYLHSSG